MCGGGGGGRHADNQGVLLLCVWPVGGDVYGGTHILVLGVQNNSLCHLLKERAEHCTENRLSGKIRGGEREGRERYERAHIRLRIVHENLKDDKNMLRNIGNLFVKCM